MIADLVSLMNRSTEIKYTPLTLNNGEHEDQTEGNYATHSMYPLYPAPSQGWVSFDPPRYGRAQTHRCDNPYGIKGHREPAPAHL